MSGGRWVRRRAAVMVVLVVSVLPVGVSPAVAGEPSPGEWWRQALVVDVLHRQATGAGVTVAVIDGPVDPSVPDLRGQDVTPVRAYCGEGSPVTATGRLASHATAITALLVGSGRGNGPGGEGVEGIAPDAAVRHYVVTDAITDDGADTCIGDDAVEPNEAVATAVRDAVSDDVDIVTISSGLGGVVDEVEVGVRAAQRAGIPVVASVGNDGILHFPASMPGVVAVGALDRSGRRARFSSTGDGMVVTAPGAGLMTGRFNGSRWRSDERQSGTSFAAPLVAGVLALVKEKYPQVTGWQLVRHVVYNTTRRPTFSWDEEYGFGIVSGRRLLSHDPTRWRDSNPFATRPPFLFVGSDQDELTGAVGAVSPEPRKQPNGADGPQDSAAASETNRASEMPLGALAGGGAAILVVIVTAVWALVRRSTRHE